MVQGDPKRLGTKTRIHFLIRKDQRIWFDSVTFSGDLLPRVPSLNLGFRRLLAQRPNIRLRNSTNYM